MKITHIERLNMTSKSGNDYVSVRVKVDEHGDSILSGFPDDINKNWEVEDDVEMRIEQKGQYLNFYALPNGHTGTKSGDNESIKTELRMILGTMEQVLEYLKSHKVCVEVDDKTYPLPTKGQLEAMDGDINIGDRPF